MPDTKYLRKWKDHWQAVLDVPVEVRPRLGRRLVRSLQTGSLAEANQRKLPVISEFKQQIADARKGVVNPKLAIIREAESVVKRMRQLNQYDERHPSGHVVNWANEEFSEAAERGQEIAETLGPEFGSLFMETIKAKGTIISDRLDRHIDEMESTNQTKVLTRSAVNRFLGWAGEFTSFEAVDRKKAREYITEHLMASPDLSKRSVERHRSHLSGLWKWADASGLIEHEVNPWIGHNLGGAKKKKRGQTERQPLKNEQVLKLLNGVYPPPRYKQIVSDLLRIGLVTGMRLDEICALRREDVEKREDGWWFTITDGKTDAAVRELQRLKLREIINRLSYGAEIHEAIKRNPAA